MKICITVLDYAYQKSPISPKHYVNNLPILKHLPAALVRLGNEVDVVVQYPEEAEWQEEGVGYNFIRPGAAARVVGKVTKRLGARDVPALRAIGRIKDLRPDIIHFFGLVLNINLNLLFWLMGQDVPPVIGHYHGGQPSANGIKRRFQFYGFQRLARVCFSTQAHADPYLQAGLLRREQIMAFMDISTHFRHLPKEEARAQTGMVGRPVFLWSARLHPIKDPMTALRGFSSILDQWPESQLYLYYLSDELIGEMKAFVDERPELSNHIHFRGKADHEEMEAVYNSADFLLQSSTQEIAGYAVLEAMACGIIPVVTGIPSFRLMTSDGQYGILFSPGNDRELAEKVLAIDRDTLPEKSALIRERFDRLFSYEAMAARLMTVYQELNIKQDQSSLTVS